MHGSHLIRSYAKTQQVLALSSGEAELYAAVRASTEVLGIKSLLLDFGVKVEVRVLVDASAALGILNRKGLGKVRHVQTQHLWVQDAAATKAINYQKEHGSRNPSDLCTKNVEAWRLREHLDRVDAKVVPGRAASAPHLK